MPPFLVFLALAGIAEGAKAYFQWDAEQEKQEQLTLQSELQTVQYQQKQLNTFDTMQRVLATQVAEATSRGVKSSSPSFNAIQRNTFNQGARQARNQEAEEDIFERNIKLERKGARTTLYTQLFGDAAELALNAASIAGKGG